VKVLHGLFLSTCIAFVQIGKTLRKFLFFQDSQRHEVLAELIELCFVYTFKCFTGFPELFPETDNLNMFGHLEQILEILEIMDLFDSYFSSQYRYFCSHVFQP